MRSTLASPLEDTVNPARSVTEHRQHALDGLRALAAIAVVLDHSYGITTGRQHEILWAPGLAGVRLFFVLSGFLITGILLRARIDATAARLGFSNIFKAFYWRRALRIFPLAYAVLLGAYLLGVTAVREHAYWYFTYTSNWLTASQGYHDPSVGHFWSLAIEEQFYLVWPTIILLVPWRLLPGVMLSAVALAGVVRYELAANGAGLAAFMVTFARLDALAWGAWLAFRLHGGSAPRHLGWLGLTLAAAGLSLQPGSLVAIVINEWAGIVLSGWLIVAALQGPRPLRQVLSVRPLAYLGAISYGIYVYHFFVQEAVSIVERRFDIWLRFPVSFGTARFMYVMIASVGIAAASWHFFEKPVNDLKRFFPYIAPRSRPAARAVEVELVGFRSQ